MSDITIEYQLHGDYDAFTANSLRGAAFCGELLKGCPRSFSEITWAVPKSRVRHLIMEARAQWIDVTETHAPSTNRVGGLQ